MLVFDLDLILLIFQVLKSRPHIPFPRNVKIKFRNILVESQKMSLNADNEKLTSLK